MKLQLFHQIEKVSIMVTTEELIGLLNPVVAEFSLDLDDLTLSKAGKRRVLEVTLDGDEGVDLDEVAAVSRAISEVLDETDVMGSLPYTLEVGTRGVNRPLVKPVHWARNIGRLVVVAGDAINATGRIVKFVDPMVTLEIGNQERTLSITEISRANIEVEFKKREQNLPVADEFAEEN
jgi:ribosome maturation factor RimP